MTVASDNEFPSLLVKEGTAPASPAAGDQRLFIDSADHALKVKNSGGTVTAAGATPPVAPGRVVYVKASTNYTTTSDSFADVDTTNLAITAVFTASAHARITVSATVSSSVSDGAIGFDIDIDGTKDVGGTYGMPFNFHTVGATPLSFSYISASALAAGSHVFKISWRKIGAITATIMASSVYPVIFTVEQMGS